MTPEERARVTIDQLLDYAGWDVQDREEMNLFDPTRPGVAVREAHLRTGYADYLLFVDGKALGVIEAKKAGTPLSGVEAQSARYSVGLKPPQQAWLPDEPLPFLYESTGIETYFTNKLDPEPRSRPVFAFHRPETLRQWVQEKATLRGRLQNKSPLLTEGLWPPQQVAITNLEDSLSRNRPRALIQMATGSGKTFTAVNFIYRLIKHADARRVLFLVDRTNLGLQAENEFRQFQTPEGRKFGETYNIRHLTSNLIDVQRDVNRVYISTVQRLYAMLKDQELEEEYEAVSMYEAEEKGALARTPRTVSYRGILPVEFFDFIVIDECHRSIYTVWRQVLDYFDASYIGLTATPGKQTVGFFDQNLVMEYGHERAVADGINVAGEVYTIRTRIGETGSTVDAGHYVGVMDKSTRAERQELLDETLTYEGSQLDRDVVSPSQIRTVIRHFRDVLFSELFPGRADGIVPKTLIFAKNDNHVENIVRIVREEFDKGNDFCQKITYRADRNPEDILQDFRNSYHPRIAVTVDMIATGTDVRAIEILLFMRRVKSRGYFEQMRGRATRVIKLDELQAVTRDAPIKDHFLLIDAVGMTEAGLIDTTPVLNRKRSRPLDKLLEDVAYGQHDEELVATLAGRLARLEHKATPDDAAAISEAGGELSLPQLVRGLLDALDRDLQVDHAYLNVSNGKTDPTEDEIETAAAELRWLATEPLRARPTLRQALNDIQDRREIIVDRVSEDTVTRAAYDEAAAERLRRTVDDFRQFIEDNKDEITALQILYNRPYGAGELTLKELRELAGAMKRPPHVWTEESLWKAYAQLERDRVRGLSDRRVLTDLVALVRHALQPQGELSPYPAQVQARYQAWLAAQQAAGKQFTPEQRWWLDKIAEFIGLNLAISRDDFEIDGEFVDRGGIWGMVDTLGADWQSLLDEMNQELVA
jgi:type I restriction enzyme R subunit